MTDTIEHEQQAAPGGQQVLVRSFDTQFTMTGPRTLAMRIVPWNEASRPVGDMTASGKLDVYIEGFRRGAFDAQVNSAEPGVVRRIGFKHAHIDGLGYLGPFSALRDEPDGLHGEVMLLRSKVEDVQDLLDQGVQGVSMEFLPLRGGEVREDGVRWRTRAKLVNVALEAEGAYRSAQVLSMRDAIDDAIADEAAAKAAEESERLRMRRMEELDAYLAEQRAKQDELRTLVHR